MSGLTPKQKKFCDEYIKSGNATQSAERAGYSIKTAYSIGGRLLKNVEIKKYIEERMNKAGKATIATAEEVLEYLSETMRSAALQPKERTKAAELLGKRYALFTDKVESRVEGESKLALNIVIKDCSGNGN